MISKIVYLKDFYNDTTKKELNHWTLKNYHNQEIFGDTNNNPPRTSFTTRHLNNNVNWPNAALNLQKDLINFLNLKDFVLRFGHGLVNSVCYEGCIIWSHKDSGGILPGYITYHCNCVTKKPIGGETVIEGQTYDIAENDVLCYAVSELEHSVKLVQGSNLRILWSFCFHIPNKYFSQDEFYNSTIRQEMGLN